MECSLGIKQYGVQHTSLPQSICSRKRFDETRFAVFRAQSFEHSKYGSEMARHKIIMFLGSTDPSTTVYRVRS